MLKQKFHKAMMSIIFLITFSIIIPLNMNTNAQATISKTDVIQNSRVVFFGDSLTMHGTWPNALKVKFNLAAAINEGVGGNTSTNGLARFDTSVKAHNPDFVIINFGMNDHVTDLPNFPKTSKELYKYNLETIVDKVRAINAIPVFFTTSYMIEEMYYTRHPKDNYTEAGGAQQLLDDYIEIMRQVAVGKEVGLVDVRSECDKYSPKQLLADDGVHLADLGNQLYTKAIGNFLNAKYTKQPTVKSVTVRFINEKSGASLLPAIRFEGAAGARIRLVAKQIKNCKLESSAVKDHIFTASANQEYVFKYANINETGDTSISHTATKSETTSTSIDTSSQINITTNQNNKSSDFNGAVSSTMNATESTNPNSFTLASEEITSTNISSMDNNTLPEKTDKLLIVILSVVGVLAMAGAGYAIYYKLRR